MSKVTFFLLCCFVAFLPSEMMAYFGESATSGSKLVGAVVTGAALFAFLAGQPIRIPSLALAMRLVLVLWAITTLVWSLDNVVTMETIQRHSLLFVFALLIWEFSTTYERQAWLLRSLLAGMLVPLFMQFFAFNTGSRALDTPDAMRYTGGGQDANYLSCMYSATIVFAAYLTSSPLKIDKSCRWLYWAYIVVVTLGIGLTGSRGGILCAGFAVLFGGLAAGFSLRQVVRLLSYIGVIGFAGVAFFYIIPTALRSRLSEFGSNTDTLALRMGYWTRGLNASFNYSPLGGVGAGAYGPATTMLSGIKTGQAHNIALSVLVELGVVGLVLFLAYMTLLYRSAWRMPFRERMLCVGVLTVWFVGAMSSGSQIDKFGWFIQAMIMCHAALFANWRPGKQRQPMPRAAIPSPMPAGALRPRLKGN